MVKTKFITTPIYYVSDKPHIGHTFTSICADYMARFYRSMGYDTFFLTGTDEHGKKVADSAEVAGKSPKDFVDSLIPYFKEALDIANISNDNFIRTTDPKHEKLVQDVFQKFMDNGDLYKDVYKGKYCVHCERYYGDDELLEGDLCPDHKAKVIEMEEESYFFRLSKYQDKLIKLLEDGFIYPEKYRNEVLSRVKKGLKDISVSRKNLKWGIPLPFDKDHVVYVWYDALLNYMSGVDKTKYWPPTNLIGKDILWFHAVYWPCMLFSLGEESPKLLVHGWWTVNGEKMSKFRKNVMTPDKIMKYGVDVGRFFLLRQMSYGEDSDFNNDMFAERYSELLNSVSNLVYRVAKMAEKNKFDLKAREIDPKIKELIDASREDVEANIDVFRLQKALARTIEFASSLNKYINEYEPWKQSPKDAENTLYNLIHGIEFLHLLIEPATPDLSKTIKEIFGFKANSLKDFLESKVVDYGLPKPKMLLTKIEEFEF